MFIKPERYASWLAEAEDPSRRVKWSQHDSVSKAVNVAISTVLGYGLHWKIPISGTSKNSTTTAIHWKPQGSINHVMLNTPCHRERAGHPILIAGYKRWNKRHRIRSDYTQLPRRRGTATPDRWNQAYLVPSTDSIPAALYGTKEPAQVGMDRKSAWNPVLVILPSLVIMTCSAPPHEENHSQQYRQHPVPSTPACL